MKKNLSLILFFYFFYGSAFAQNLTVVSLRQITDNAKNEFYYPQISADGSRAFFTSANYKGIWYADLPSGSVVKLTDDEGAGYGFTVSSDSRTVFFRSNIYDSRGFRAAQQIKEINISGPSENILAEGADLSVPAAVAGNDVFYTSSDKLYAASLISSSAGNAKAAVQNIRPVALIEHQKIALYINGQKKVLSPLGEGNYIWPSVSPDGTRLLFTFAGKGSYISDLNGNILLDLGYANAPGWSPDGRWVIYMNDHDNGIKVTSSDIFAANAVTGSRIQLTSTGDIHEMYPAWNNGSNVVFNSSDGKIFIMQLKAE
ncbi:MAG: TolB family protein [Syntrophothermus sp.]